ncbi:helix-turn-helix domain-containing protein [Streptomyces iconiensis]|uniref:Helix-turn-helix domain-containing protein n=1 Tax=Streptomyces iconiensis TaxID=1384038 RepID=A0ABT6ZRT1_9ACTN|nr:helix-turn-helix domain-containing protein [Streptomyces iconiensis]MDJ1131780.1 helix-turn-helix domain-containing protein [Streptomyces iconiensis]
MSPTPEVRRRTVRRLADEGLSRRQIAARLGISARTVGRDLQAADEVRRPARRTSPRGARAARPGRVRLRRDLRGTRGAAPADEADVPGIPPYADPGAVRAIEALRTVDADAIQTEARRAAHTRPYVVAALGTSVDLLTRLGPDTDMQRRQLALLAARLHALAESPEETSP